jgi:TolB-like protein
LLAFATQLLRFGNNTNDPENAVFVDWIHDDLLTKLANIKVLRVISLTSVLAYKDSTKNICEINR